MNRAITTIAVAAVATTAVAGAALAQDMGYPRDGNVNGRVVAINEDAGTFTVADRYGSVKVDIGYLGRNPLDDTGRLQIERNDLVSASGQLTLADGDPGMRVMNAGSVSLHIDTSDPAN